MNINPQSEDDFLSDDECVYEMDFTDEERKNIFENFKQRFPDIPEDSLRQYVYGPDRVS